MSSFTSPLELEYIDGKSWLLKAPFVYELGSLGSGISITVPEFFVTDFASIPRGLWNLFPPTGEYGKAAVIHDYLYRRGYIEDHGKFRYPDRGEVDAIFRDASAVLGVNRATRWTMWLALRGAGWSAWNKGHAGVKHE